MSIWYKWDFTKQHGKYFLIFYYVFNNSIILDLKRTDTLSSKTTFPSQSDDNSVLSQPFSPPPILFTTEHDQLKSETHKVAFSVLNEISKILLD